MLGVIFVKIQWVYLTPRGALYCFFINFKEIPSCVVLNVCLWLLCIIKWTKLRSYLHYTYIWDHLLSKFGNLTPYDAHRINPTVLRLILKKYNHILCPVCIFVVTFYDQMVQIVKLFAYNQ